MKKFFGLTALFVLSLVFSQETNIKALKELSQKFEIQHKTNEQFVKSYAQKHGWINAEQYNLVGKMGDFLVFLDDLDADQIVATNTDYLYNNTIPGVSVTGNGMTIYQWDGGRVDETHQEYAGRITNMEGTSEDSPSPHSTAVAGVMVATGVNEQAQGMAYEADVIAYNNSNNFNEIANESANNPDYMVSNHSYGYTAGWRFGTYDETFGEGWYWFGYPEIDENESVLYGIYSPLDQYFDEIAEEAPNHLIIKAAGNDRGNGPTEAIEHYALNENDDWQMYDTFRPVNCGETGFDCLPYGSIAKNILLVGSIDQISGRYESPENVFASSFSSFGPTDDGRIKPDIVAQGQSVYVTTPDNNYYGNGRGTSFSSPSITGIAALLQQLNFELNDAYLTASELKALLLNTTNETGSNPGPDYAYGFGLADAFQAANLLVNEQENDAILFSGTLTDASLSYQLTANGNEPIRATLVWIDPAIDADDLPFELNNRTSVLVNDLDMRITSVDAVEYIPWTLDVENPSAAAVPGDNMLDNVEQILIDSPDNESYTLTISHKGLLDEPQNFAIVVSGAGLSSQATSDVDNTEVFSVYPNPAKDVIHLNGISDVASIKIFNMEGKVVMSQANQNNSINISKLTSGIYLILVKDGDKTFSQKFIKK